VGLVGVGVITVVMPLALAALGIVRACARSSGSSAAHEVGSGDRTGALAAVGG